MIQNPFEIPQQMRELAEKNIEQARAAYDQFMGAMNQAMGMWAQSIPGDGLTSGGYGLTGMRERAELLGGSFKLETGPGQGTVLRLRWPLIETEEEWATSSE